MIPLGVVDHSFEMNAKERVADVEHVPGGASSSAENAPGVAQLARSIC
jgi:hypothetical protein